MRLLEVRRQRLEYFVGDDVPPYAILSHTWGKDEVLFEHIRDAPPTLMEMDGWKKVHYTCTQARLDGYDYVWIDTCCIDKSSSAELSEAINSMFKWYLKAAICYAYLSDVNDTVPEARFEDSRWFTRGWTLQELIAPSNVIFYDSAWKHITSRQGLSAAQFSAIQRVTNLPEAILRRDEELFPCQTEMAKYSSGHDYQAQSCRQCSRREDSLPVLDSYIFAERMSWAAKRETTRVEDRAYSLLGLFGVSMPLLYGEGGRAFLRLQEEILKQSNDQSVLVFARPHGDNREGLLAESPDLFAHSQVTGIVQLPDVGQRRSYPSLLTIGVTAKSIELEMLLCPCTVRMRGKRTPAIFDPRAQARAMYEDTECWIALLPYVFKDDLLSRVGIFLARAFRTQGDANRDDFKRVDCQALVKMSPRRVDDFVMSWSSDRGWNMDTGMNYYYDADRCLTKTVRLYLAPSTAIRSTVIGNAPGPGTGTAVSAATILKLPAETYRYIGGAPGAGRPVSTRRIARGHIRNDQYYIPPTFFEGVGFVSDHFPQDVLGIICISHVRAPVPFLVIWGEGNSFRKLDLAGRRDWVWCKVLSASDIKGWDQVVPSMLPRHLLGSDTLGQLVKRWKHGGKRDMIKHSTCPCNGDQVDVEIVDWLGVTIYEIVVTLAKDLPYSEEPHSC